MISNEAEQLLFEIMEHKSESGYWKKRFDEADEREDAILRGCFKELREQQLVDTKWASNIPYYITILKDGYLYQQHKEEQRVSTKTEKDKVTEIKNKIYQLLKESKDIKQQEAQFAITTNEYIGVKGRKTEKWMNDILVLSSKLPANYPLVSQIQSLYNQKNKGSTFDKMCSILETLRDDDTLGFDDEENKNKMNDKKKFDVFLSHANKDKLAYVNELYNVISRLNIEIGYDKNIGWGDNWKEFINKGINCSEFAILVISNNYFDREWTEKELYGLLKRQNDTGQKIILPLLFNISVDDFIKHYPELSEIQAISAAEKSKEDIAFLLAEQLIKRYKGE